MCRSPIDEIHKFSIQVSEKLDEEKKRSYDSDEDEANPLVIEEEDYSMQPEEPQSENDDFNTNKTNSTGRIVCCIFFYLNLLKFNVLMSFFCIIS